MVFPNFVQSPRSDSTWVLGCHPILSIEKRNEDSIIENMMSAVSSNYHYKIYTSSGTSNHDKWAGTKLIHWYMCTSPGCHVQYQVRRDCTYPVSSLAIYINSSFHSHSKIIPSKGLNAETKKMLDEMPVHRDHGGALIRKVTAPKFPEHLKTLLTNGINTDNLIEVTKFKRQCSQYIYNRNRKLKNKTIPHNEIGTNYSEFRSWLKDHLVAIQDLKDPRTVLESKRKEILVLLCNNSEDTNQFEDDHQTPPFILTTYELLSAVIPCIIMSDKVFEQFPGTSRSSMVEIDYTSGLLSGHAIGCVGASDCDRKFFPILYEVNSSENGKGATASLRIIGLIFQHYGGKVGSVLKDGGSALSSAAKTLRLKEFNCLSHMIRQGWAKRGHGSG
jgi:hypothetical protein